MLVNIPFVPMDPMGVSSIDWGFLLKCHRDSCPFYWKKQLEALYPQGCFAQNLASEASKSEPHGEMRNAEPAHTRLKCPGKTHTRLLCTLKKIPQKQRRWSWHHFVRGDHEYLRSDQGPPAVRSVASVVSDSNFFGMMDLCFCKDIGAAQLSFRKCQGTNLLWRVPRTSHHAGHLHLGDSQWKIMKADLQELLFQVLATNC